MTRISIAFRACWLLRRKKVPSRQIPFVDLPDLAELKKTNREKEYAIIGELARRMATVEDRILYSRSALEIVRFHAEHPDIVTVAMNERGIAPSALSSIDALEAAIDAERRRLMHAKERRVAGYRNASRQWNGRWYSHGVVISIENKEGRP
jgi:hypothetical protein